MRFLYFCFSILCYLIGVGSMAGFFYFVQFVADRNIVPFNWNAVLWNCLLFLIFPLQHSLLARPVIKGMLPPKLERSLYVATSGIAMWIILFEWNRIGPMLYEVPSPFSYLINTVFYITLILIILTTREMDHWRMFAISQGYAAWKQTELPVSELKTSGLYAYIRHPLTSLFIVTLWCHPTMSMGRLWFNLLFTAYALVGTIFEERDLKRTFGQKYLLYARRVGAFVPRLNK